MFENLRLAIEALAANKLRSALTVLGITIGVAAVILLISLGQAVQNYIFGQFSSIGTNLVYVFGGVEDNFGRVKFLTQSDADALADIYRVPDAVNVMPTLEIGGQFGTTVASDGRETTATVIGATTLYPELLNRTTVAGRYYTEEEELSGARVAVIGQTTARNLFGDTYPVGQTIRVNDVRLQVIGVLNRQGGGFGPGADFDNLVLVPLTTAQQRLNRTRTASGEYPVASIIIEARDDSSVDAVVEQARQTLREEHGISFRDEDDFEIATQEDLLSSLGSITGLLTVFLGIIAGISLIVGGIGIMNIMLVTVTERTREIGLRKAVGAQKFDILFQFLSESVTLAVFGGTIGVLIAWGLGSLIRSAVPDLAVSIQASSVALATIISIAIGVFFGIYPANRAADLNPIDALRYE